MQAVAKVVTEAFLVVLAALSAPDTVKEFRMDMIFSDNFFGSTVVKRVDDGFNIYAEEDDKLVEIMVVKVSRENPNEYNVVAFGDKKETVNFANAIKDFNLKKLRKEKELSLEISDGTKLTINRSAKMAYLIYNHHKQIYAVQCFEQAQKPAN